MGGKINFEAKEKFPCGYTAELNVSLKGETKQNGNAQDVAKHTKSVYSPEYKLKHGKKVIRSD